MCVSCRRARAHSDVLYAQAAACVCVRMEANTIVYGMVVYNCDTRCRRDLGGKQR